MERAAERILITGANGNLGRQLVESLSGTPDQPASIPVRALVRSERAAEQVRNLSTAQSPEVVIGDYTDETSMRQALTDCDVVVHLVGIIKEGGGATYEAAHEETCQVLARCAAQAGVRRIIYLSIVGSRPDANNACLRSKGQAEAILEQGSVPVTVIRVPMVLGPDDIAASALRKQAQAPFLLLVAGGRTMQQPIDSEDVLLAVRKCLEKNEGQNQFIDLGGPERLTHRDLITRVASLHGRKPFIVPIPMWLARGFARSLEKLLSNPPVTVAMLEVLQHDDRVDEARSCETIGMTLKPLDSTLKAYVGPDGQDSAKDSKHD